MILFILIFVLAMLPSLTWLLFYWREDPHPEPPRWLWLAFLMGVGAAPVSFYIERMALGFTQWLGYTQTDIAQSSLFMFLGIALVEELTKFGGAKLVLLRNPVLDEPVDAMIYMITAALGFAAFENVLVLNNYAGIGARHRPKPKSQTDLRACHRDRLARHLQSFYNPLGSGLSFYHHAASFYRRAHNPAQLRNHQKIKDPKTNLK